MEISNMIILGVLAAVGFIILVAAAIVAIRQDSQKAVPTPELDDEALEAAILTTQISTMNPNYIAMGMTMHGDLIQDAELIPTINIDDCSNCDCGSNDNCSSDDSSSSSDSFSSCDSSSSSGD
jgi:hypothetical protein